MQHKNLFPYDIETRGVIRKKFADAEAVLHWWESFGEKTYRYAATNWDVGLSMFLDKRDWLFSNDKTALVKEAMQWDMYKPIIEWKTYDSTHPIMGQRDDAFWMEEPDGWWEIIGLPFGLTSFDVITCDAYTVGDANLLNRDLSESDREMAIIEGIFKTGGLVEDNNPESMGMRGTHDVDFLDTTEQSLIAIIQDELAEISNRQQSSPIKA